MKRLDSYSQHFLRSPHLVKELVGHSSVKKTDVVYDIGAGSGVITSMLAGRCKRVVAIEAEPRTAQKLRTNMQKYSNVTVVESDVLAMKLPRETYKIFANIPFHLSSAIVQKFTEADRPPVAMHLIVQKQFANKLLVSPAHFTGQLGGIIAPWFTARIRKHLRRTDFWPHPNVDTVLLELKPRDTPLLPIEIKGEYKNFVANCFSTPKFFAKTALAEAGIASGTKPSQLQTEQWVVLFLKSKKDIAKQPS